MALYLHSSIYLDGMYRNNFISIFYQKVVVKSTKLGPDLNWDGFKIDI
jgi:hypothetical protein